MVKKMAKIERFLFLLWVNTNLWAQEQGHWSKLGLKLSQNAYFRNLFSGFYFVFNAKCTKQSEKQGLELRCLSGHMNLVLLAAFQSSFSKTVNL